MYLFLLNSNLVVIIPDIFKYILKVIIFYIGACGYLSTISNIVWK